MPLFTPTKPTHKIKAKAPDGQDNVVGVAWLNEDDFNAMHELQEGLCAICEEPESQTREDGSEQLLAVDHDHANGRIRGLLCARCNLALGQFRDDPKLLRAAIEYLGEKA